MARSFSSGSSQYLQYADCPVNDFPVSWAIWWYPTDQDTDSEVFYLGHDTWASLGVREDASSDFRSRLRLRDGSGHYYTWGPIITEGTWVHLAGRLTSTSDTDLFTDGDKDEGSHGWSGGLGDWDRVAVGRLSWSTPTNYSDGNAAYAAVWNAGLADDEFEALAHGYCPLGIRPASLLHFWPLFRGAQDWVGGWDFTEYNSPGVATHPPPVFVPPYIAH